MNKTRSKTIFQTHDIVKVMPYWFRYNFDEDFVCSEYSFLLIFLDGGTRKNSIFKLIEEETAFQTYFLE